jgi:hypothetical protein
MWYEKLENAEGEGSRGRGGTLLDCSTFPYEGRQTPDVALIAIGRDGLYRRRIRDDVKGTRIWNVSLPRLRYRRI